LGGAVGALAGPQGAMMGSSLGGSLGGAVGQAADPAKVSGGGVPLTAMEKNPEIQLAQLVDAQKALMEDPSFTLPEKEELSKSVFTPTIEQLKKRMGGTNGQPY
jgi:hypothetical protein